MNRLTKKAWKELIIALAGGIWAALMISIIAYSNMQGLGWILLCVLIGAPVFAAVAIMESRKLKILDEREKELTRKSEAISFNCLAGYLVAFSILSLFVVGGRNTIPVVVLPMMVLVGLVLEQCVRATFVLLQCEKDDDE